MLLTIRGTRGGLRRAPLPPAPTLGSVPRAPMFFETSGSLVGQATLIFRKALYLQDGDLVETFPITSTTVRISSSEANARAGVFLQTVGCGTSETTGVITLSAGTYWSTAVSANANGSSDPSPPFSFTVT